MDDTSSKIVRRIDSQVERKIAMKRGYRKKIKTTLERSCRKILHRLFFSSAAEIKRYEGDSSFGCDEFGRDVESGIHKYVKLLENREVKIHTVIVLGSRAKGTWKPESDVDVTIIASNLPKEGKNFISKRLYYLKTRFLLSDRPLYLGIEPSGCVTKEEFIRRLEQFDIQALDAIFFGRVIFDDGFWQTVRQRYEEIEKKYKLNEVQLKEKLKAV
jgi:predicted nucleotidyltransferase